MRIKTDCGLEYRTASKMTSVLPIAELKEMGVQEDDIADLNELASMMHKFVSSTYFSRKCQISF